jgi:hypothetical protein
MKAGLPPRFRDFVVLEPTFHRTARRSSGAGASRAGSPRAWKDSHDLPMQTT